MPFFYSDLYPLKMRVLEALDKGKNLTFRELRDRIQQGEFTELINEAGRFVRPEIPDSDWQEITESIKSVLFSRINDEAETFYIQRNGYCLLMAVLLEIEKESKDIQRLPPPNSNRSNHKFTAPSETASATVKLRPSSQ